MVRGWKWKIIVNVDIIYVEDSATISGCAVFLSEGGVECVTANKKELLTCVKKSVPEAFSPVQRRRNANNMHFYVFQKENCR